MESLVVVLDSFNVLSRPRFKLDEDLYLCALQSVKASSCALGQIAHYGRENAIKILEKETALDNLIHVLTSEGRHRMKMIVAKDTCSKQFREVILNEFLSTEKWCAYVVFLEFEPLT